MTRSGWCLIVFMGRFLMLGAQVPGLLTSDERYSAIPLLPSYSGVKYTEIPIKVSLRKYCPVPGNQGRSGACVGWAIGYGALSILRAVENNNTDQARITQQANSAAFLFNQVKHNDSNCEEGAFLEDGLQLVKKAGDCLEQSFNYQQIDCTAQPQEAHFLEAKRYKIQDFASVFALDEEPKSKISKACKILATQTPVIVGVGVTKSFFEVLPGADTWKPARTEDISGYHAMVLVGYNSVEKYFEFLNSFGASWGKNGFIKMSFEDFARHCRYAFVMIPDAGQPAPAQPEATTNVGKEHQTSSTHAVLEGEFVFRQPAGFVPNEQGENLIYFEEVATKRADTSTGLYYTEKTAFNVGDVFQLVAREIPRGRYVYVFSQSANRSVNQHFPRESAGFVLQNTVEIVIPGEESLLQIPTAGDDYLCIVYSCLPVENYADRLEKIKHGQRGFVQEVQNAFADLLITAPNLQFSSHKMSFTAMAEPEKGKVATAMILRVQAN